MSLPPWLNELEADEAFHVYDHPAVFIFRKSPDYSRARVEAALAEVSLKQAHELNGSQNEAQLLGVFYWTSAAADAVPTALTFTHDEYARQTSGGTWSERFFSDSIINTNQAAGVFAWYATIFVFGALAFPLVFSLFPSMADGGYGVCKLIGMLLVAFFAWGCFQLENPHLVSRRHTVFQRAACSAKRVPRIPQSHAPGGVFARSLAAARLDGANQHHRLQRHDSGSLDQSRSLASLQGWREADGLRLFERRPAQQHLPAD